MKENTNPFHALAKSLWARGEDGEVIARLLANATQLIIEEGIGKDKSVIEEFARLLKVETEQ